MCADPVVAHILRNEEVEAKLTEESAANKRHKGPSTVGVDDRVCRPWSFTSQGYSDTNFGLYYDTLVLTRPRDAGNQGESLMSEIIRAYTSAALTKNHKLHCSRVIIVDLLAARSLSISLDDMTDQRQMELLRQLQKQ